MLIIKCWFSSIKKHSIQRMRIKSYVLQSIAKLSFLP